MILGYELREKLHEGPRSRVYRGVRAEDGCPVIVKLCRTEPAQREDVARFQHDYDIAQALNGCGAAVPLALETFQNRVALVSRDFGGVSLTQHLSLPPLAVSAFFPLAMAMARALEPLHAAGIIHSGLQPDHILLNPYTGQVAFTDFSLSTRARRLQQLAAPGSLGQALGYISPEQTGRMSRAADHRTDFYSLGAIFYWMLLGSPPFEAEDSMELVYAHLARTPESPRSKDPRIPQALSNLVMKLLAKNAEDRYATARGLRRDLEQCQRLEQERKEGPVDLGQHDVGNHFDVPQKLYGREAERAVMLDVFEQARCGGRELVLVSGYSGIGKSALVNELNKPVVHARGYFISGKFDQFQRNVPYNAPLRAFGDLIRQLLSESDAQIDSWRSALHQALGPNGQVIVDVLPELALIIGSQPAVAELPPAESQNRFTLVFSNFIRVFTQKKHPLVLFLDDLQWVDFASLRLLESLMTASETGHLLVIGSFRDNEVDTGHPLTVTLAELSRRGVKHRTISLSPLRQEDLTALLRDSIQDRIAWNSHLPDLVQLVLRKTDGNPFFVGALLKTIHAEGLLAFDEQQGGWSWDISSIEARGISDDAVDLMVRKIRKLPAETQDVLKLAASIGNTFTLRTLSIVHDKDLLQTMRDVQPALTEGLLITSGNTPEEMVSKFLHDRVQQAAYLLIPEHARKLLHLRIGRLFLETATETDLRDELFAIVGQLNGGHELMEGLAERLRLAELNLMAGKRAKESAAYEAARRHLAVGLELLPENAWEAHYALTSALHRERAECEYLCSNFELAEQLFDTLLQHLRSHLEQATTYSMRIVLYETLGRFAEAISVGQEGLRRLGLHVPQAREELRAAIEREMAIYRIRLAGRNISSLVELPLLRDELQLATVDLLMNLCTSAFFSDSDLLTWVLVKVVNLSLEHGNGALSPYAYAWFGAMIGPLYGELRDGYSFGLLSLELNERLGNVKLACKLNFMFACYINHWRQPAHTDVPYLRRAYQLSQHTGDITYGGYSLVVLSRTLLATGEQLERIHEEIDASLPFLQRTESRALLEVQELVRHVVLSWKGCTRSPGSLSTPTFDDVQCLRKMEAMPFGVGMCVYHIYKMQLAYAFGEPLLAVEMGERAKSLLPFIFGFIHVPDHAFFHALSLVAACAALPGEPHGDQREAWRQQCEHYLRELDRWAENAPGNFMHKRVLVEAELARLDGRPEVAMRLYQQATKLAQESEFLQDAALAQELAGLFYLESGFPDFAGIHLARARALYEKWGAAGKVAQLDASHASLMVSAWAPRPEALQGRSAPSTSSLDTISVLKASQTLSGEIQLDRLLQKMMRIVIENAGARKGVLLLLENGELRIEAQGTMEPLEATVLQSTPLEAFAGLPQSVIRYVERTRESVVLNNATRQDRFMTDPYVVTHRPRALLCAPILTQGKLLAILYLENDLTTGAFTPERLDFLTPLAAQAAISIENAQLYARQQRALDAEKRANQLKDEFLANTSHELRTPLNGIMGLTESLLDGVAGPLAPEADRHLRMVVGSARRLFHLVSDLLDFSRLRHERLSMKLRPVELHSVVAVVLELLQPLASGKRLAMRNAIPTDLPTVVDADEDRLQQILHNLVGNAIKFTESGSVEVGARLDNPAAVGPRRLTVTVTDTGIGIEEGKFNQIFKPFEQANGFIARRFGGTGLGLAIVKELVELHGGTVGLSSQVGVGSTFWFTLSLSTSVAPAPAAPHLLTRLRSEPEDVAPVVDLSAVATSEFTVLAVDDEPVNLQVITNQLGVRGHRVLRATSGDEALRLLADAEHSPDLVLMDVMMPGLSGFEVCRRIRERLPATELPVVILTAKDRVSELVEAMAAGANDYLTKPFIKDELLARVETQLRLGKANRELRLANEKLEEHGHTLERGVQQRTLELQERNTELHRAMEELKQAQRKLVEQETLAALGTLTAGVAHEIKNPLNFVNNFAEGATDLLAELNEAIQKERLDEGAAHVQEHLDELVETLAQIVKHGRRADRIASMMREQASCRSSEQRLVDVNALITEYVELSRQDFCSHHPGFTPVVGLGLDTKLGLLEAAPHDLSRVFINIADNALHALHERWRTEGAGFVPRLMLSSRALENGVELRVRDNGSGVPVHVRQKLFEPFFTTRAAGQGIGLGLPLCYNIVVRGHGGDLRFETQEGEFTEFIITLPRRTAA